MQSCAGASRTPAWRATSHTPPSANASAARPCGGVGRMANNPQLGLTTLPTPPRGRTLLALAPLLLLCCLPRLLCCLRLPRHCPPPRCQPPSRPRPSCRRSRPLPAPPPNQLCAAPQGSCSASGGGGGCGDSCGGLPAPRLGGRAAVALVRPDGSLRGARLLRVGEEGARVGPAQRGRPSSPRAGGGGGAAARASRSGEEGREVGPARRNLLRHLLVRLDDEARAAPLRKPARLLVGEGRQRVEGAGVPLRGCGGGGVAADEEEAVAALEGEGAVEPVDFVERELERAAGGGARERSPVEAELLRRLVEPDEAELHRRARRAALDRVLAVEPPRRARAEHHRRRDHVLADALKQVLRAVAVLKLPELLVARPHRDEGDRVGRRGREEQELTKVDVALRFRVQPVRPPHEALLVHL
mmetsp:Transcript_26342/g.84385  ORF Transcript_26342/g.84385 Transcript_26342/m.84385 type:complete len:415 (+) Transcript_26342:567-1811(+)